MTEINEIIKEIEVKDHVVEFFAEIEEQYLEYLNLLTIYEYDFVEKFLNVYRTSEMIDTNKAESNHSQLVSLFQAHLTKGRDSIAEAMRHMKQDYKIGEHDINAIHKRVMQADTRDYIIKGKYRSDVAKVGYFVKDEYGSFIYVDADGVTVKSALEQANALAYYDGMGVAEFAKGLNVEAETIIRKLYANGILVGTADSFDFLSGSKIAAEYGIRLVQKKHCIEYVAPRAEEVPEMMHEVLSFYNSEVHLNEQLKHPFLKAAVTHALVLHVQPYMDGNSRTSRVLHHAKLWQHAREKHGINLSSPAIFLSRNFSFDRDGYRGRLLKIDKNPFSAEAWNNWLFYNALIMQEALGYIHKEVKTLHSIYDNSKSK